jgi:hypothetical protein
LNRADPKGPPAPKNSIRATFSVSFTSKKPLSTDYQMQQKRFTGWLFALANFKAIRE